MAAARSTAAVAVEVEAASMRGVLARALVPAAVGSMWVAAGVDAVRTAR